MNTPNENPGVGGTTPSSAPSARRPFNRNRGRGPRPPHRSNTAPTGTGATPAGARQASTNHAHSTPKTAGAGRGEKRAGNRGKRRNNNDRGRRSMTSPALSHRMTFTDEKSPVLPEILDDDTVRIITVAGVEEIGRNMNVIETKDDMIIIDAGFQFVSEESNAPGINYILPNTQYIEERKHKIRALIITHGHLDHIGGIPFILERIGNPPIYTQYLTSLMILKRQDEFPHLDPVNMNIVKEGESFTVGKFKVRTFPVTHSIPDAMGLAIETKHGDVVITGDIKVVADENNNIVIEEKKVWEEVGTHNNIALLCDSTNADRAGFSVPEAKVYKTLDEIIKTTRGRLIIGTFASQFDRLVSVIQSCEAVGKKVVMEGRSIKTNIDIAITAKLIEVKPDTFISANDIGDYPADRIVILSTGAQGEEYAALMRMATDKHKQVILNERDTVVLSSSVIPGNELAVQKLKDNIYRRNVRVMNFQGSHVHASGHGNAGELVWVHQAVKPRFLIPVHGHHYHVKSHMFAAVENGFPRENIIVPDNGTIIDIKNGTELIRHKVKIPTEQVLVDGFTVGMRQEVVLRDRLSLAQDGMFVIIATVNTKNGKLRKSPDIISRGFVYLRENQQLLSEARVLIKKTIEKHTERMNPLDLDFVKDELADTVSGFLMQRTQKSPMVIPVLIGI
jgi:ribonuclease J